MKLRTQKVNYTTLLKLHVARFVGTAVCCKLNVLTVGRNKHVAN